MTPSANVRSQSRLPQQARIEEDGKQAVDCDEPDSHGNKVVDERKGIGQGRENELTSKKAAAGVDQEHYAARNCDDSEHGLNGYQKHPPKSALASLGLSFDIR